MFSRTAFFAIPTLVLSSLGSSAYGSEEWYAALTEKQPGCVSVSTMFPGIGPNPPSRTPGDVAEFARRAGYPAEVQYLSPTRASVNTTEGTRKVSIALFSSLADCQGFLSYLGKATSSQQSAESRLALSGDRRPPIGLGATLAGSKLRLLEQQKCQLEEVVAVVPGALGGREVSPGGYINLCWWRDSKNVYVVSEMGSKRVYATSMFYPIKE